MLRWGIRKPSTRWTGNTRKRMPLVTADPWVLSKASVEQDFLENCWGTRPLVWSKRFTRWPLPAIFYMCMGFILNQNTTNGILALKRAQVLSNTFGSAFQPDTPFTPFKLQSFLYSSVFWPICIQIFKALLCLGLYYHLVFQSLCLPASLPSITLSDRT